MHNSTLCNRAGYLVGGDSRYAIRHCLQAQLEYTVRRMAHCRSPRGTETHCSRWFLSCDTLIWLNTRQAPGVDDYTGAPDTVLLLAYPAGRFNTRNARSASTHSFARDTAQLLPRPQRSTIGETRLHCLDPGAGYRCFLHAWKFYCALQPVRAIGRSLWYR